MLEKINSIEDLKKLNIAEKEELAKDIRKYILEIVSENGGHLASNLGVVELTIALHSVYNVPDDKIIWDVGHQTYVHKILTGRKEELKTLRKLNGIAGFPKTKESETDCFNTGHSSTSISAALGMARARDIMGKENSVVAVIGDGALTGGMAIEALNDAGYSQCKMTVILNDNEMSISKNVGGLNMFLSKLRTKKLYTKSNISAKKIILKIPLVGKPFVRVVRRVKRSIKQLIIPKMFFEDIGFTYLGPVDGHNIQELENILRLSKQVEAPVLVHVLTKKGKGYKPAEDTPAIYHSTSKFNIKTGEKIGKGKKDYSKVFGEKLVKLGKNNKKIVAITAAMTDGTGLTEFSKKYPKRFFDVGIAEQHAIGLAAGLAKSGLIPVVPIYSSFIQRAYDQLVHDVAIQNLPVVVCADRAGIVGNDGETHQGLLDMSFTNTIPNFTIMAPKDFNELEEMLEFSIEAKRPILLRYPRGGEEKAWNFCEKIILGKSEILRKGKDVTILAIGKMVGRATDVAEELEKDGIECTVINSRFLKPFDEKTLLENLSGLIVTIEDGTIVGGLGSKVEEVLVENKINTNIEKIAYPDEFIKQGSCREIEYKYHLDKDSIKKYILENIKIKNNSIFSKNKVVIDEKNENLGILDKIKLGGEKCLTAIQSRIRRKKTNS